MENNQYGQALKKLIEIVERLRSPGGCPWDAEQTDDTIKSYLLEEAYEVLDALDHDSPSEVCLELGDLLFQIIFLATLAHERNEFDMVDIMENISEKMIRRHPHVFGDTKVKNTDQVLDNWFEIKKVEKKENGQSTAPLSGIPTNLPALMRTHRLTERAHKETHYKPSPEAAWKNVHEYFKTIERAVKTRNTDLFKENMGTLLFNLATLSRLWGFNSEELLRKTNTEYVCCFEHGNNQSEPLK